MLRNLDQPGAMRTCYLPEENLIGYPDHFVQSTTCHPMEFVANTIKQQSLSHTRIGVEMDNYYFTAAAFDTLKSAFPSSQFH